ncbi:hypothetical protein LINPERPRIM_LOCUS30875, partial [Linum perenne]
FAPSLSPLSLLFSSQLLWNSPLNFFLSSKTKKTNSSSPDNDVAAPPSLCRRRFESRSPPLRLTSRCSMSPLPCLIRRHPRVCDHRSKAVVTRLCRRSCRRRTVAHRHRPIPLAPFSLSSVAANVSVASLEY